ncbi:MAG TPA: sigma-70 family RNA polymerase sigma factor [Planctomycetota bacterium]|jgi:RNA polymerase sigma-70 factor (ECF subfamily)
MNQDDERSLIDRFRTGDQSAFAELFEAHHRRVLHLGLQVLRNEESALDASQEVFLRAFEELPHWRGEARFSTWLYRTALNVCFERIRAENKQRRIRDNAVDPHFAASPEISAEDGEIGAAIDLAVQSLPPRQRAIFALKQYEDMRFSEIASLLDITEGGAKASYHKALLSLRERLRGWAPEASVSKHLDEESAEHIS